MLPVKADGQHANRSFTRFLLDQGFVTARQVLSARSEAARVGAHINQALLSLGFLGQEELTFALAAFTETPVIELGANPPDAELSALFDASLLLRYSVVPLSETAGVLQFAISDTEKFAAFLSRVGLTSHNATFVFATSNNIQDWLVTEHRQQLISRASARVPEEESCRTWERPKSRLRLLLTALCLFVAVLFVVIFPQASFAALAIWACATLLISAVMRTAAYLAEMATEPDELPPECPHDQLPKISVLVPLFKETEIATTLLKRLAQLTYPKPLLDVVLAVEEADHMTRETIGACELPPWMHVVVVPEGSPKTKPRALNYALDFCQGDIIGIWDAEDAPSPEQLETVARYFHTAEDDLVCLQGVLDYYNSKQNWLARCFTIEYAAWFRLLLPGMARLGFAIPLGGTTLFFKRDALERLGGWDAHNVTEDADLGFRLARHGYRTEVIRTRTGEEANCKPWPWVKQRSRWLKGYLVTYLVHMRYPRKLLRQLGAWRFIGFQAHFVTALSQFILAPILWSFWLVLFGLPHPLEAVVSRDLLMALGVSFLVIEIINAIINATAVARPGLRHLLVWVPTMHFYYPLGAIAAYKALYELVRKPFYWDKTQHGLSLPFQAREGLLAAGVQSEPGHKSF